MVLGFAGVSIWKGSRKSAVPETHTSSGITDKQKEEVRRFWDVFRRANDLRLSGTWEEAAAAYSEALVIDPQHEDALYHSGNVLFELGKYDLAAAAWRRMAAAHPLSARAHFQLGALYSCGAPGAPFDLGIAEQEFQRALAINQEETGPILKLGEVHVLGGRLQEALSFFKTAIKSNPKSVEAYYMIGYIEWRMGEKSEATGSLQRALTNSRVKLPVAMPLGEGDTKTGSGPILAEGASRRNFFSAYWMALRAWDDGEVSDSRLEEEYGRLDRQLQLLTAN